MTQIWDPLPENHREFKCLTGAVITLEGLIGTGKSVCGSSLSLFLNRVGIPARYFPEYKNEVFLTQYINDMKKYAYAFQVIMLMKRLETYREASRLSRQGVVVIIDRSLIGDYTFAQMQKENGNMTESEWEAYLSMLQEKPEFEPTLTVYLNCTIETALVRTQNRGIQAESNYSADYFRQLQNAYEKSFQEILHPIVRVDWNAQQELNANGLLSSFSCILLLRQIRTAIMAEA